MIADMEVPLARGPPATCGYEASCAHAIETSLGIQGLGMHREHDRIVTELASTVDGADPLVQ
jgi:hypothetical protein